VTAVSPSPVFDPSEIAASSPYFQEPLMLVIGTHRDDDFLEFRVVGRRFEPFDCRGGAPDPDTLLRLLAAECDDRTGSRLPMGFVAWTGE
jgi:hypothetical protein